MRRRVGESKGEVEREQTHTNISEIEKSNFLVLHSDYIKISKFDFGLVNADQKEQSK